MSYDEEALKASNAQLLDLISCQSPPRGPRPIHVQVMAVMTDGTVKSLELPTEPQDDAEISWHIEQHTDHPDGTDGPERTFARSVRVNARVTYGLPLHRDGGLFRIGTFGGAQPDGEIPGRQVPDYVVAQIAQLLAGWSPPPQFERGTEAYNQAVRAQATMTGQWIWQHAWQAGMVTADQMGMFRQRVVAQGVVSDKPVKMPLFNREGLAVWLPPHCPVVECHKPVTQLTRSLDDTAHTDGRREVTAQPCGHRIWVPDPIEITFS